MKPLRLQDSFRVIFESLPSGVILFARDGEVIQINSRARELLGIEHLNHLDELDEGYSELREVLRGEDVPRAELDMPGGESTIGFSLKTLEMDPEEPYRIFVFSDITAVVRDRLMMDRVKDELHQSRKLASIGTMISGVAHELNNPLTGLSMNSQLLQMMLKNHQQTLPEDDPSHQVMEKALANLQKSEKEMRRASALVKDLLEYSKPNRLSLAVTPLDSFIGEMTQAIKSHPDFSKLTFKTAPVPSQVELLCDRLKLEQVFYNLLKNARDAAGGDVTIALDFEEELSADMRVLTIHVRDDGPGMDHSVLGRIFDPFFTTKGAAGVGLGLSICYRTVEQHGGRLSVSSEKGEGTTFHIQLPIFEEDEAPVDLL